METIKNIPKNKIKNKKGQPIEKHLKTKNKIDQKKSKNTQKIRTVYSSSMGPNLSLFFSCYALAALQPPSIKTSTTRPPPEAPSPPVPLPVTQNGKKRPRLGGSTYMSRKSLKHKSIIN